MAENREWIPLEEAMRWLGCSRDFIEKNLVKNGLLHRSVLGRGKSFYRISEINKLLENNIE